jgi:hypothetical protein
MPTSRKTKIICTLGPACWSEEGLAKLLEAGMNVARFNFSHGSHESHQEVLDRLRKVRGGAPWGCMGGRGRGWSWFRIEREKQRRAGKGGGPGQAVPEEGGGGEATRGAASLACVGAGSGTGRAPRQELQRGPHLDSSPHFDSRDASGVAAFPPDFGHHLPHWAPPSGAPSPPPAGGGLDREAVRVPAGHQGPRGAPPSTCD